MVLKNPRAEMLIEYILKKHQIQSTVESITARELVLYLLKLVNRDGIEKFINYLEKKTDYFTAPASTKYHGNYSGALAEHHLFVYALMSMKNETLQLGLSEETVILSTLAHDLCKCNFYAIGYKNEKVYRADGTKSDKGGNFDWEAVEYYTVEDALPLGHGEKSVIMLSAFVQLKREEILLIRWHMGQFSSSNEYDFSNACEFFPPCVAIYTADMEAAHLFEATA